MKNPYISTNKGRVLVTEVPNDLLASAFLQSSNEEDAVSLVNLLVLCLDAKGAGRILRKCLTEGKELVTVYPGNGEKEPKKGEYIGPIPDGSLFVV